MTPRDPREPASGDVPPARTREADRDDGPDERPTVDSAEATSADAADSSDSPERIDAADALARLQGALDVLERAIADVSKRS